MKLPETIRVTQEHIDQGEPQNGSSCPIALALQEQWDGEVTDVEVLAEGATVYTPGGWYCADTWPQVASSFVEEFDYGEGGDPVEFPVTWHFHEDPEVDES